ncbi:MAG: hypothetical protein ACKOSS_01125 [Planctomycetia bacterium]
MRPVTKAVIVLFVLAFGALFWLASASLDMVRPDIEAARVLGQQLREAGLVEGEVPVRLRRMQGSRQREGPGLNMELVASAAACRRPGGLDDLAQRAARAALEHYGAQGEVLGWWKVTVELPGGELRIAHVDLLGQGPGGAQLGPPEPALPRTWPVPADPPSPAGAPGPQALPPAAPPAAPGAHVPPGATPGAR